MDKKLFLVGASLIALAVLFSYCYNNGTITGFFSLGVEPAEQEEDSISPGLSFTVLKLTTLEASLSNAKLQNCPEETQVEILVKNTGQSQAEKLFLKFGSGVKVIGCSNCRLDLVEPEQEVLVKVLLCIESARTNSLTVGSANSNRIELGLE